MPDNPHSPHGNHNPLERVIKQASNATSYSWCTCSEEVRLLRRSRAFYFSCIHTISAQICTEQLGGRVAWNQNGLGWKGYVPPTAVGQRRPVYNAASGLPPQGHQEL